MLRIILLELAQCRRDQLGSIPLSGAHGVGIPLTRTRLPVQSAVDECLKLGLPIFGVLDPADSADSDPLDHIRRLVEAYPNLDGYVLAGVSDDGLAELTAALSAFLPAYRFFTSRDVLIESS